jgi:hypothetical protein
MLRKHDSPNITLSFDAASPFVNTAYGQTYAYNIFENKGKRFGYFMDRAFDNQMFKGSKLPAPFGHSPIMSRLTIGDLCCMAEGDLNRNGKPKEADSTSWDTLSYILYMGHSVYNHITAVQEANRLTDIEKHRLNWSYKDFIHDKKSKATNDISPYVPADVIAFDSFVQEVLDPACPDPHKLIDDYDKLIQQINFGIYKVENEDPNNALNAFFEESTSVADKDELHEDEVRDYSDTMMDPAMTGDFFEE